MNQEIKRASIFLVLVIGLSVFLYGCVGKLSPMNITNTNVTNITDITNVSEAVGREAVSESGWVTHTYENEQMGFALSFDTPEDWVATGPLGERQVGGWYDPAYSKPLNAEAVWCYWITASMPGGENQSRFEDPITITSSQKKVSTVKVDSSWAYHLICVSPVGIYDQKAQVIDKILARLRLPS